MEHSELIMTTGLISVGVAFIFYGWCAYQVYK